MTRARLARHEGARRSRAALLASLLAPTLLALPLAAHVGAPEGRFPFVAGDDLVGGGTTWGIIRREGDRWLRVCEEALEEPPAFYYRQTSGTLLVARSDGLWATTDGCALDPQTDLFDERRPSLSATPRGLPETLFVATARSDGGNGVYVSRDEGETFAPTGLTDQDVSFRSLAASDDGEDVYAGGIYLDSREPVVFVSHDGGETFTAKAPFADGIVTANIVGLDPETGELAFTLMDPEVPGSVLALTDADVTTVTPLASFTGVVSDFLVHDGAWLVIESRQRYYRREKGADAFTEIEGGPTRCLLKAPGDERVWGCGQPFQNGHFLVSDDGVTFTPVLPFLEVEEYRCPEGTLGAERCAYLWGPDAGVVDPKDDDDGGGGGAHVERPREETPPGCPCSSAGGADPSLLGLVLLTLALGRGRRGARRSA